MRAVPAPQPCCARDDCCLRQPTGGENDLEAIAARVVREMSALQVEAPPLGRSAAYRSMTYSSNLATAINGALRDALPETPDPDVRVISHPDSHKDHYWVGRYRIVRKPERAVVLDFAVSGGLGVVMNRHGSWIVHSPPPRGHSGAATRSE